MIFRFGKYIPMIHPSSFVHPMASVTGNVTIGKNVFIGSGAALRGDIGEVIIEDGCNVQENCILHMFPGMKVWLKEGAHIGHGAIVHGAEIGRNVLVGMNAVIMDHAKIGDGCIIGAMSLITEGAEFPGRKVIVGNPAKVIKEVSDEMLEWKTKGTQVYIRLVFDSIHSMKPARPLRKPAARKKEQEAYFKTWKKTRK